MLLIALFGSRVECVEERRSFPALGANVRKQTRISQPARKATGKEIERLLVGGHGSDALDDLDAVGEAGAVNLDSVVGEGAGHSCLFNFDQVEEFVAW